MATIAAPTFSIEEFLREERGKDIFRFSTAGSVDDGKSTLIGRLLYDTQSIYDDQIRSIQGKGTTAPGQIDFALLTDGLRAEREQGITIDVAYRYFSTAKRKFIIADTPGHEQYTRNMATGASTADATIVLIDASKGVLLQSRRHAYIASLLRVQHLLVAVNKMDLIDYDEGAFHAIARDFKQLLAEIAADTGNPVEPTFVPVSALAGDNIVHRSVAMPWYQGPSLLELLESLPSSLDTRSDPFRFPVQRVVRPDHTFRGFAGQIASGTVYPGDTVTIQPSGRHALVERIVTWNGDLSEAYAPLSVTLVLDRELDISRGDLIVSSESPASATKSITAALVWMDQRPLDLNRRYLIKHISQTTPAFVSSILHRTEIKTLTHVHADTLQINDIGIVTLSLLRPIAVELYADNRSSGAFILIDPHSKSTVAAGMVTAVGDQTANHHTTSTLASVTKDERAVRWGHRGARIELIGTAELIDLVERSLYRQGAITARVRTDDVSLVENPTLLNTIVQFAVNSGLIALVVTELDGDKLTLQVGDSIEVINASQPEQTIVTLQRLLEQEHILVSAEKEGLQ